MPLPSEILTIIHATEAAGKAWLNGVSADTAAGAAQGAAESFAALEAWRKRMAALNEKWGAGILALVDFKRACESEAEALPLNLAAIGNERKREFLSGLLGRSLDFLGSILGAGLAALKGGK